MTYSVRAVTAASVSTAPGVGSWPRNTVPSRSRSKQSCSCARVVTSGELRDPLFGVGHALDVCGCGVDEPLQGFVGPCRVRAAFQRRRRTGGRRSARSASDRAAAWTGSQGPGPVCPRSDRAPATTIRSSSASSPVSCAASGLRASSIARSGRPTPRSQSAISGNSGDLLPSRRAARSSASAWAQSPHRYAAMPTASRTAGIRPERALAARACSSAACGILVEQFARGHQVARDEVSGIAVECGEFSADFRRELSGFDVRRQRRAALAQ